MASAAVKKFVPILDKVLLEKIDFKDITSAGLYLPARLRLSKCVPARVVAVGGGKVTETGKRIPNTVKVGDTVLLPDHPGTTIRLYDREFELYEDDEILAVVKEDLFAGNSY
ncbi:10 kDa heat shock protein, mitochondrial [Selaginella moellendorffii]|uniref:10 kDa heat shock protein, mitochondrial n=1 Tax=Selaginella moellendorffii TaxID=88036 RepID=UPI000D1CBA47|nr:10 kDa heat shock protein, mitochondrial [Selaginella moellendorffii]|eukprot:XP_024537024.1 10 kDa heat shock protein, mitochondrial [Selaginella moellendorffii]